MSQHKEQQGFVTLAINNAETDYLELAYLQALNVKATQQNNRYAVIVDTATNELVTDKHRKVFDYVIVAGTAQDYENHFRFEPFVWYYTPFKETIKLESDLLFTRSIDHWWTTFRLKDVCLSHGAKTAMTVNGLVRKYREAIDANGLPDVYNGLMYFRFSQTSKNFFDTANGIFNNWDTISNELKLFNGPPTTDEVYALTSLLLGPELVTIPSTDFLNFVHMKSGFQGWSDNRSWVDTVLNERDGDIIRINNLNQYDPVHYYDKSYATQELIEYYEQRVLG